MHQPYLDILSCLGRPAWWDENGVPRYEGFHPQLCADIYADFAALLAIRCQGCSASLNVSSSWSVLNLLRVKGAQILEDVVYDQDGKNPMPKLGLPSEGNSGPFGYADAPWHGREGDITSQCAGTTMTTSVIRIVQFWRRDRELHDWVRDTSHEVYVGEDEI